jgi:hypothetical protein
MQNAPNNDDIAFVPSSIHAPYSAENETQTEET